MSITPHDALPHPSAAEARGAHRALGARAVLMPLALTQFVASFAGSNMNVAITNISQDLGTTVHGVQTAITLFLLCMAALMIPGSKLTDRWGRKRCLMGGLTVYGTGAVIGAVAPGLGILIVGYSAFQGVGSALMIPPIYILATMFYPDTASRARAFGAVLSAAGMGLLIIGILQAGANNVLMIVFMAAGALALVGFFWHVRTRERGGREPLLSTSLFRNRTSNLALVTQNVQWLLLLGSSFVVTVFLQVVRGYSAIKTGVVFTAATAGILLSSLAAERLAKRLPQRSLIAGGFIVTLAGIGLLLGLYKVTSSEWVFAPGLFLMGVGVGLMLTPSVNVVQSAFPEEKQGEISGLSRSVSNLGSSMGTAIAGTILVADIASGNQAYALAMIALAAIALIGLAAAFMLPTDHPSRDVSTQPHGVSQP